MSYVLLVADSTLILAVLGVVAALIAVLVVADFARNAKKYKTDATRKKKSLKISWVKVEDKERFPDAVQEIAATQLPCKRPSRASTKRAGRLGVAACEVADKKGARVERSGADRTRQTIVNIDTLNRYFQSGECVNLCTMRQRIPFFDQEATSVKVLSRGILTKRLEVQADVFSPAAKKNILSQGGSVVVTRK